VGTDLSLGSMTVEAGLSGTIAPALAMIHVETELVRGGGVELRLGVHLCSLGGTGR
jgi:hypothetical protein